MKLQEVKELLKDSHRFELRDHAFGDREVIWTKGETEIAWGYFSGTSQEITGEEWRFEGKEAEELLTFGTLTVERNDETGPDTYQDGVIMEGLTLDGVLKEITKPPVD